MKPTLNVQEQAAIGFASIRAAVTGGHDLRESWKALADLLGDDGRHPAVVTGATGCLLYLTAAVERAGFLPVIEIEDLNNFLHLGHSDRIKAIQSALLQNNKLLLYRQVLAMITCIAPHQDRVTFAGDIPTVGPIV